MIDRVPIGHLAPLGGASIAELDIALDHFTVVTDDTLRRNDTDRWSLRESPNALAIGRLLGHYRLIAKLGQGATARVYLARHELLGSRRVLKIRDQYYGTAQLVSEEVFLAEAAMMERLDHANVGRVVDAGRARDAAFIVFAYRETITLSEAIRRRSLDSRALLLLAHEIAKTLDYCERQGVIHGDINPENILVCDDGHPLIIDFGAAALAASGRAAPGAIVGSPPYVPPERIRGMATLESPGDMYALGATLYHALVGSPPFARSTPRDMLLAHLYQSPLSVFAAMPDVPADLGKLVMRLLEKTPERRFTSWAEASEQFAACRADAAQNRPIRIMA